MNTRTRRSFLQIAAGGLALPFARRLHAVAPSATLRHASFGAAGMARADIDALTASPHVKLVAVAEVDRAKLPPLLQKFPDLRVYADGRELLEQEKDLDSVNVSTPDHAHALFAARALKRGLHVYCQKPLTHTVHEARVLTDLAAKHKCVTQMGIQIHSHSAHLAVVELVQSGVIGKVKATHSWSGKMWGARGPRPDRSDPVPAGLNWDLWLGGATERPYLHDYYHPAVWRCRLDFGGGNMGDMACHILDPVFTSLGLTAPTAIHSVGPAPGPDSWDPDVQATFEFPGTQWATDTFQLSWYNGARRPAADVLALIEGRKLADQGSIYVGEQGVIYSPYIGQPLLHPTSQFRDRAIPKPAGVDHYRQFVDACRGQGTTTTPFSYAGPLTEAVLLGCLSSRFPNLRLGWNAKSLMVEGSAPATALVRKTYRKGWEVG